MNEARIYDAIVVGSGAAGLSAAVRLKQLGKNVALVTENLKSGTSRNTGSDKQTYYKLSLGGNDSDSVAQMAANLFSFGSVDGDNALCEAALSSRCFFSLVEGGVPFPHNRYGEYVGYKTDHDPFRRATSAGPLTSKFMTEMWERQFLSANIPLFDHTLALEVLHSDGKVCGLAVLDKPSGEVSCLASPYVILATGGPAGIYADSVYPMSQTGATGLAIAVGASLQNLTEWQYGLASIAPRWNVSGTYMQVLPRFVSVNQDGNEFEFLSEFFADPYEAMSRVFLKGYQWPFDCRKVSGSSVIDLLVFYECSVKKRRVFLDFTQNPFGLEAIDFSRLSPEAFTYLKNADALFGTPIERLQKMNSPAIELYQSKGVDITKKRLEIALCAQHHNGGIAVDKWWMTDLPGLFAIGECAGTHGIARPGGSALNAGQVGAVRAAQFIALQNTSVDLAAFQKAAATVCATNSATRFLSNPDNVLSLIQEARRRMSDVASAIRDVSKMKPYLAEVRQKLAAFDSFVGVSSKQSLYKAYKYLDLLLTQEVVLAAMIHYAENAETSRGSALLCDPDGFLPAGLDERFRFRLSENTMLDKVQMLKRTGSQDCIFFRNVRPIPVEDDFFENVWADYRKTFLK